jgi:hypothetical protein
VRVATVPEARGVIGATSSRVQVAQTHGPCAHSCLHSDNAFVFVANFTFAHDFPDDNLQSASHTLLYYDTLTRLQKRPLLRSEAHNHGMTSLQTPARTADESQQNNTQDDDIFEQIEAPVTFKVSDFTHIRRKRLIDDL